MPIVDIYAGETFIGEAVLDGIDEGMAVASGSFRPEPAYSQVRSEIMAAAEARSAKQEHAGVELKARTKAGEQILTGFVVIDDFPDVNADPEATLQFGNREEWWRLFRSAV